MSSGLGEWEKNSMHAPWESGWQAWWGDWLGLGGARHVLLPASGCLALCAVSPLPGPRVGS